VNQYVSNVHIFITAVCSSTLFVSKCLTKEFVGVKCWFL